MGYNCIVFRDMGEGLKANDDDLDETRRLDSKKVDIVVRGCSSLLCGLLMSSYKAIKFLCIHCHHIKWQVLVLFLRKHYGVMKINSPFKHKIYWFGWPYANYAESYKDEKLNFK